MLRGRLATGPLYQAASTANTDTSASGVRFWGSSKRVRTASSAPSVSAEKYGIYRTFVSLTPSEVIKKCSKRTSPWIVFRQTRFAAHLRSVRYLTHLRASEAEMAVFWPGRGCPKRVLFSLYGPCLVGGQKVRKVSQIPSFAASSVFRKLVKSVADLVSNGVKKIGRKSAPDVVFYETSLTFWGCQKGSQNRPLQNIPVLTFWAPKVHQVL